MSIITLTTDWGNDFYAGIIKGRLYQEAPGHTVVDLSHHISPFSLPQAAWVVARAFSSFPAGTVHLISIHNDQGNTAGYIAVRYNDQYMVAPDNGLVGMICTDAEPTVVRIEQFQDSAAPSFPAWAVLTPAAAHLANGGPMQELGPPAGDFMRLTPLWPTLNEHGITGTVMYIDSFKNLITNVTRQEFERMGRHRSFEIFVASHRHRITTLHKSYQEVSPGELVALFNASGYLEIAMNRGPLAEILNISIGTNILIKFAPETNPDKTAVI